MWYCLPVPLVLPAPQVKDLVELVQKARMAKILGGLATLGAAITVKLNNLAAMEINAGGWWRWWLVVGWWWGLWL